MDLYLVCLKYCKKTAFHADFKVRHLTFHRVILIELRYFHLLRIPECMNTIYQSLPGWTASLIRTLLFGLLVCLCAPQTLQGQANKEYPEITSTYCISNANIVVKPGVIISNGSVVIKDGLIQAVGKNPDIPPHAKVIPADSMYVYAGFIDGLSHAGIQKAEKKEGGNASDKVKDRGSPRTRLQAFSRNNRSGRCSKLMTNRLQTCAKQVSLFPRSSREA